ncbi:fam-g protein [Plasmodium gallinaceum]|uniref:Fam-g protein n=1 Tax=Plasmodium gallinaceum TaxID=5849 RepID=A0A1J1GT60_PLAGA|nr:fam-g protein [Plasmodium gallinaceum]CRG94491.1 fam-g protein [Plasmodium gallinaceum]
MKTLILYLKITTFLLLIWIYQCFYNCDSYKTLIDKNILQTKNELKYERVLTEGDIEAKRQAYAEGCPKECSLDNKKNKCEDPFPYENPCDHWHKGIAPQLWELFDKETSGMDPKWRDQKWNNEWNKISAKKVNDLPSIYDQQDISEEEKKKKIDSVKRELILEFMKFLDECKKEMRDNKTESECKNKMRNNRTESECMKEMRENNTECESKKEIRDNKIESEFMKEIKDNKTEFDFKKEMRDNETESESKNEQGKNKMKNKKANILKFLFKRFDNH